MIARVSKSRCPSVRAVNDWMRHTGLTPSADAVNAFIAAADGCLVECTPEAFGVFQALPQ